MCLLAKIKLLDSNVFSKSALSYYHAPLLQINPLLNNKHNQNLVHVKQTVSSK